MQRILIIEDDEAIAAIERDYLEIDGFAVETAPDGESGLTRGLTGQFDLILLDLMLPGLDGFAVCRRLRDALDIPILMVTARQEDIDKIRGLGFGADDYIEKPFPPACWSRVSKRISHGTRGSQTPRASDTRSRSAGCAWIPTRAASPQMGARSS